MHDLRAIKEVCDRPDPLPEFDFTAQVRPLKAAADVVQRLDTRLDELLGDEGSGRIALAVPSECRERFDIAGSFKVSFPGRSRRVEEMDDTEVLIGPVRNRAKGQRLPTLRKGKVQMFADTEARKKFLDKLTELDSNRPAPNLEEPVVVLGILLKEGERITPDSLFAFAKITLLHTDNMLKGLGARLEVVSISR